MSFQPYLAEICLFSFNVPPKGWAQCNGQLLPINQNQALFSLLGTTYGGNGTTNFALPDLRGRVPMGVGGGHTLGQSSGSEAVTLALTEMAAHSHTISAVATAKCKNGPANQVTPAGNVPAIEASGPTYSSAAPPDATMSPGAIVLGGSLTEADAGSNPNQPHENRQPFLTLNYCIALLGIFPSQN